MLSCNRFKIFCVEHTFLGMYSSSVFVSRYSALNIHLLVYIAAPPRGVNDPFYIPVYKNFEVAFFWLQL